MEVALELDNTKVGRTPNQYDLCPHIKREFVHRQACTQGKCHEKIGFVLPQAKQLPEVRREA